MNWIRCASRHVLLQEHTKHQRGRRQRPNYDGRRDVRYTWTLQDAMREVFHYVTSNQMLEGIAHPRSISSVTGHARVSHQQALQVGAVRERLHTSCYGLLMRKLCTLHNALDADD